ncbi:hypothetical protein CLOP_g15367, partial [Closterium sp. NIES-67]
TLPTSASSVCSLRAGGLALPLMHPLKISGGAVGGSGSY